MVWGVEEGWEEKPDIAKVHVAYVRDFLHKCRDTFRFKYTVEYKVR